MINYYNLRLGTSLPLLSWMSLEGEMEGDVVSPGIMLILAGGVLAIGELRSCIRKARSYTIRVPGFNLHIDNNE